MSGGNFLSKVRSALRRDQSDMDLSDTTPFDFSDELVEDEAPKFNKLKVVVSGEMSDYSAGAASNGVAVNTLVVVADDDDSLLESSSSLGSPGLNMDPCDNCTKKREKIKHRRVMKRLVIAALLYILFMTGEIIGTHVQNEPHTTYIYFNILFYHCWSVSDLTSGNFETHLPQRGGRRRLCKASKMFLVQIKTTE